MSEHRSFMKELLERFPAPETPNIRILDEDRKSFEAQTGIFLPDDLYEFLRAYGHGNLLINFYAPFTENTLKAYKNALKFANENYKELENDYRTLFTGLKFDASFENGEYRLLDSFEGMPPLVMENAGDKFNELTKFKLIRFGEHYPYPTYPDKDGMVLFANLDRDDYFYRFADGRETVVMYGDMYFEFDMSVTEFIYEYASGNLSMPMDFGRSAEKWISADIND